MNKTVAFGFKGALGCLFAAVLGELFLAQTKDLVPTSHARPQSRAVCLLLDCSGSMRKDAKLDEVKAAAARFASRQDLTRDRIAVVGFSSGSRIRTGPTQDLEKIEKGIDGLWEGGSTEMEIGLASALAQLADCEGERTILLFTDGMPDRRKKTLIQAKICRNNGVRIVAVGTGDADTRYLKRLTDDDSLVFRTSSGNFDSAFLEAEKAIYAAPTLVESSETASVPPIDQLGPTLLRIGAWTAILSLGIATALIVAQNRQLHRRALTLQQIGVALPGSLIAGFAAGAAGQILFLLASQVPALEVAGRFAAWTLLGALVGLGMSSIVPNLDRRRAWVGGAIGGAIGVAGFLWIAKAMTDIAQWGDVLARLAGACVLGFAIGLMIALVDVVFRRVWLEVDYGNRETEDVTLGETPVSIGSDDGRCTIYAGGAKPIECRFRIDHNAIVCEDVESHVIEPVAPGTKRKIGKIEVTVCASASR